MINVAELDERIDRCLAILADNPHSQVFAALAEAYRRRGEFGRAFSVCKSGLKHHPDYGPAYVVLAKLYLHQKMLPDALSALSRAVELDGPTRVTDILEADLQLALGDLKAAQTVVDRLRITDPGNAALPDIINQLKRLRSGLTAPPVAVVAGQAPPPDSHVSQELRAATECTDWHAWAQTLGTMQGVEVVFVSEEQGRVLAQYPENDEATAKIDGLLSLLHDAAAQLPQSVWGSVGEIRIETGRGDVWVRRSAGTVVGFVGLQSVKYGATRQRGLDLAARVHSQSASSETSDVTEQMRLSGKGTHDASI